MCGVIAIFNKQPNNLIILELLNSLKKLQNRGRDSYGILLSNYGKITLAKSHELIGIKNIENQNLHKSLYKVALGHSRYSTSYNEDKRDLKMTQPFKGNNKLGEFYLIHNGNINFGKDVVRGFPDLNDTQIMVKIIEREFGETWMEIFGKIIRKIPGVYNIIVFANNKLYAFKDRYNVRPLCLGSNNMGYSVASESCALSNYTYKREILGGELVEISENGIRSEKIVQPINTSCIFEYIYFLNPSSKINDIDVFSIRYALGEKLGFNDGIRQNNDIVVIGSPDTGIPSGIGFAKSQGLIYLQFLEKNKNKGRSFIMADDNQRKDECLKKFIINPEYSIKDKIVYFVDDSMVRGNTTKRIVKLLKEYEPREIHIRISSPKIVDICKFGIDIPTKDELIMANYSEEEYVKEIGINSLKFLKLDDMLEVVGKSLGVSIDSFCKGCFSGVYQQHLLDW